MREFSISVLKAVLAQKLSLLLGSLSPVLAIVLLYLHNEIAPHLSDPTGWIALLSMTGLVAIFPLPFAVYFWFRPRFKPLQWGVHQNIKTGCYFCSTCLLKNKLRSPLYLSRDNKFWKCSVCDNQRLNPDYKPPQVSQKPNNGPHAWMAY